MAFTAVQTAEGSLTANTVATVNFGTGSSNAIRYGYITITNDSGTTPAPIYVTVDGVTAPTIGGEDTIEVNPNQTVTVANGASLWAPGLSSVPAGTQVPVGSPGTPWQATPYGSSLAGGTANPGTTVKMISAQAMAYTVSGSG
jgi:hypothetical protein